MSEIKRVSASKLPATDGAEPLTLEVPEVWEARIQSTVELSVGQTLLLNGPELRQKGKSPQPILVAVRVVGLPASRRETTDTPLHRGIGAITRPIAVARPAA